MRLSKTMAWAVNVLVVIVALVVTTALSASAHQSGAGGNPSVIHACVRNNGTIRIVPATGACVPGETSLHWNAGRFIDLGLTVFDTATQLEWEKKTTAVGSGQNFTNLHDVANFYLLSVATGAWIAAVNAENFAGHRDWRVPTREELQSIVGDPTTLLGCPTITECIDPIFGPTVAGSQRVDSYWTTTPSDASHVFIIGFGIGATFSNGSNEEFLYVRAVRGGP